MNPIIKYGVLVFIVLFLPVGLSAKVLTKASSWGGNCNAVFPFDLNGRSYIAMGIGSGLEIIDLNDTVNLIRKGRIDVGGFVTDIDMLNDSVYVTTADSILCVIDVSDLNNPVIIRTRSLRFLARRLILKNNVLAIVDTIFKAVIPRDSLGWTKGNLCFPVSRQMLSVFVSANGNSLYVGSIGNALSVYSIITPDSIAFKKTLPCSVPTRAIAVTNNRIYVGQGPEPIVSPPVPFPRIQSDQYGLIRVLNPDLFPGSECVCSFRFGINAIANDIRVGKNRLFIASEDSGMQILDISNPDGPVIVSTYKLPIWPDEEGAQRLVIKGSLAYIAYGSKGLRIVDISNELKPIERAALPVQSYITAVAVKDSFAYIADNNFGMHIINISNPKSPRLIGSCELFTLCDDIAVADGYAYVATYDSGLQIIDVHSPQAPVKTSRCVCTGMIDCTSGISVAATGKYAFMGGYNSSDLDVFDISDKSHPFRICQTGSLYEGGIAISGSSLFVAQNLNMSGLYIYDLSVLPACPTLLGSCSGVGQACGVAIKDSIAYVIDPSYGLWTVNVGNTKAPVAQPGYTAMLNATSQGLLLHSIAISGNYALVSDDGGVHCVNIQVPLYPVYVEKFKLPGEALGISSSSGYLFVADNDGGLQILKINDNVAAKNSSASRSILKRKTTPDNSFYSLSGRKLSSSRAIKGPALVIRKATSGDQSVGLKYFLVK